MPISSKDTLKLPALWSERWKNVDPFWHAYHLQGEIFREQPGRRTLRFIEDGEGYFIKIHEGITLKEIAKNIFQGRMPIKGAHNELNAITQLEPFGFVPQVVGYGFRDKHSFIITKELNYTVSLEDFCRDWPAHSPSPKLKWALIRKIAEIAKTIHQQGINHRDFYLCHFLLDLTGGRELLDPQALNLYVIDWHRAQIRPKVPERWLIKDIAGLYFSAMDIGLTSRDLYRFRKIYGGSATFWHEVEQKAIKLYKKIWQKCQRNIPTPFYLHLEKHHYFVGKNLLRVLPKKRFAVYGLWKNQEILAKCFVQERQAKAEIEGYKMLAEKFITPTLLYHGNAQHKALYIVIYAYENHAKTFRTIFEASTSEQKKELFQNLLSLLHKQHEAGLYQTDLHLDNFLVRQNNILTIDFGSFRKLSRPLTPKERQENLCVLYSQFNPDDAFIWKDLAHTELQHSVCVFQKKRENKYLKKTLRTCTTYETEKSSRLFCVIARQYDSPDLRKLIAKLISEKTPFSHTEPFSIKTFYPKNLKDYFVTPAKKAWLNLQKQYFQNNKTEIPVALIETGFLWFKTNTYLITCKEDSHV